MNWIVFGIDMIQVIKIVLVLAITYVSGKLISKSLFKLFQKTPFPENIKNVIVKISKYIIYTIGIFVVIAFSGFDLTSLIVGLGAFSIAISFATSTIIQNLVSGLLVQADRAFQIGDRIMIQGVEGKVVKISVRTTVIETKEGHWVYIPNALFMTNLLTRKNLDETKV
ncbi:MAG TPA: mechanosensitive ion channel domain-containing protein [Patescibacteria group bacterium]|nr:mechanosensitive ion channel domain-containing protein [Patescibacteria group bacterium]